ncbi:hypothetical protein L1887_58082 [Cichorium endivia]|nr:hypothetical protein L1887_58082 [Cichorium endivia]
MLRISELDSRVRQSQSTDSILRCGKGKRMQVSTSSARDGVLRGWRGGVSYGMRHGDEANCWMRSVCDLGAPQETSIVHWVGSARKSGDCRTMFEARLRSPRRKRINGRQLIVEDREWRSRPDAQTGWRSRASAAATAEAAAAMLQTTTQAVRAVCATRRGQQMHPLNGAIEHATMFAIPPRQWRESHMGASCTSLGFLTRLDDQPRKSGTRTPRECRHVLSDASRGKRMEKLVRKRELHVACTSGFRAPTVSNRSSLMLKFRLTDALRTANLCEQAYHQRCHFVDRCIASTATLRMRGLAACFRCKPGSVGGTLVAALLDGSAGDGGVMPNRQRRRAEAKTRVWTALAIQRWAR